MLSTFLSFFFPFLFIFSIILILDTNLSLNTINSIVNVPNYCTIIISQNDLLIDHYIEKYVIKCQTNNFVTQRVNIYRKSFRYICKNPTV